MVPEPCDAALGRHFPASPLPELGPERPDCVYGEVHGEPVWPLDADRPIKIGAARLSNPVPGIKKGAPRIPGTPLLSAGAVFQW